MQMDIKIAGITEEIMKVALDQAKEGRTHILGEMAKALDRGRAELGAHAPRIETMQIDKSKIREVIGTGGKVIREIVAKRPAPRSTSTTRADQDRLRRRRTRSSAAIKWIRRHRVGSGSRQDL